MSTERQIVEKFKEALETKDMGIVSPYLAEGATVEILPSTFVIVPLIGTSYVLTTY